MDKRDWRIGNDLPVIWTIKRLGVPENYAGRKIEIRVNDALGRSVPISYKITGNVVRILFRGKDQRIFGWYSLLLTENAGLENMSTLDVPLAFRLVAHSCCTCDLKEIDIESDFCMPANGLSAYEQWIANGHEGTMEDWDRWLREPATEAAADARKAIEDSVTATANANAAADKANTAAQETNKVKEQAAQQITEIGRTEETLKSSEEKRVEAERSRDLSFQRMSKEQAKQLDESKESARLANEAAQRAEEAKQRALGSAASADAATANANSAAEDARKEAEKCKDKQDALVSGVNIKTINGESVLGEGNLDVVGVGDNFQYLDDRAEFDKMLAEGSIVNPSFNYLEAEDEIIECNDDTYPNVMYDITQDYKDFIVPMLRDTGFPTEVDGVAKYPLFISRYSGYDIKSNLSVDFKKIDNKKNEVKDEYSMNIFIAIPEQYTPKRVLAHVYYNDVSFPSQEMLFRLSIFIPITKLYLSDKDIKSHIASQGLAGSLGIPVNSFIGPAALMSATLQEVIIDWREPYNVAAYVLFSAMLQTFMDYPNICKNKDVLIRLKNYNKDIYGSRQDVFNESNIADNSLYAIITMCNQILKTESCSRVLKIIEE